MAEQLLLNGRFDRRFTANLGGYQYKFTLYFNKAINRWLLDCQDRSSGDVLFSGAVINVDVDLFVNLEPDRGHLINVGYGDNNELDARDLSAMRLTWFEPGV